MRKRTACILLVVAAVLFTSSVAHAFTLVYAGPKTWLQGWDAEAAYDGGPPWWWYNEMGNKSCGWVVGCYARVTFINTSGGWTWSQTDIAPMTYTWIPSGSEFYLKKPYCKNNSSMVYTAHCLSTW
jgi:hypothetical protein